MSTSVASSSSELLLSAAQTLGNDTPRSANIVYKYGTAGFRANASILDSVCLRMGMLAALRSRCFPTGWLVNPATVITIYINNLSEFELYVSDAVSYIYLGENQVHAVGAMLTASHNPVNKQISIN